MKTIARAFPNPRYEHYNNLKNITLEARLVNDRIMFYEVNGEKERQYCLSTDTVRDLFAPDKRFLKERPFLERKPNEDFWAVLNRHRRRYQQRTNQLIEDSKPKLIRTKPKQQ